MFFLIGSDFFINYQIVPTGKRPGKERKNV